MEAAGNRTSPARLLALATVGLDGKPQARTVMLRDFRAESRELTIHTDFRTPKVEEIRRRPGVQCVFWDRAQELQLRVSGNVAIHAGDALARIAWEGVDLAGKFSYLTAWPPGGDVGRPTSGRDGMDGRLPSLEEAAVGWDNFAALLMTITEIDWVLLDDAGHRRARFTFDDEGLVAATWLIP
jgi:pyridoxamine 5'-phosphate oxidase